MQTFLILRMKDEGPSFILRKDSYGTPGNPSADEILDVASAVKSDPLETTPETPSFRQTSTIASVSVMEMG